MVLISVPVEPKKFQKNRGVEGRGEAAISYPLPQPNTPGRSVPEEAKKFQKNRGVEGRGEAAISPPPPRPNTPEPGPDRPGGTFLYHQLHISTTIHFIAWV
jgi:hypothetical protein